MSELSNTHTHREAWLNAAAAKMGQWFTSAGYPLPAELRMTCGFPITGARAGARSHRIGECWDPKASGDHTTEIMISPVLEEPMRVFGTLVHELVHAAVGCDCGHKGPFKKLAVAVGFIGKMTSTEEGPEFIKMAGPILEALGPYPHAAIDTRNRKKQGTRLMKAVCEDEECGFTVRITRKWVEAVGAPHCPAHGEMAVYAK